MPDVNDSTFKISDSVQDQLDLMQSHTHVCPGCGIEMACGCSLPTYEQWCGDNNSCDVAEGRV